MQAIDKKKGLYILVLSLYEKMLKILEKTKTVNFDNIKKVLFYFSIVNSLLKEKGSNNNNLTIYKDVF